MKATNFIKLFIAVLIISSCGSGEKKPVKLLKNRTESVPVNIPIDKGFSEYISAYTSGIIPANSAIEIRFTPEFAARVDKSATGLFDFDPAIKGKTEWKDDATLIFTPSRLLDAGKMYTGKLNLNKLAEVKERLNVFPLRIQTLKKDFRVTIGALECSSADGNSYLLHGQIVASDFVEPSETEKYIDS